MRLCVSCVYWTLLLVSVVSSCLLFLIVASEGTHISEKSRGIGREDNVPSEDVVKDSSVVYTESLRNKVSDVRARPTVKTEKEHLYPLESDGGLSGRETDGRESNIENNLNVLKQSLTPQPNLSQGISETGQAVVLTLVDTATAELQSLAEPRLSSEIRSRTLSKNTTLKTTSTGPIPATTTTTTTQTTTAATTTPTTTTESGRLEHEQLTEQREKLAKATLPIVTTESSNNLTKTPPNDDEKTINEATSRDVVEKNDEVVIVRAQQRINDDTTARKTDEIRDKEEIKDRSVKHEESSTGSPELDDSAARAKLVGGSSEESAAVILDGFVTSGTSDHHHEDIPSFSEWAQKRLEEAEKKKTHPNASVQNPGGPGRGLSGMKVRSKNYASPDCGAKIVAVNPEARSARSVLVSTRDEYMLNTCTSRVWFVVELCEAIQAKKIELANFELFSSSPKDFNVHVSDRFPTRDWIQVGQFTAKDQRDIQSFTLHPHLFGKFIKIELQSHYGSEHFCPMSLFRAYGTSEFEVLETETDHRESDDSESNSNSRSSSSSSNSNDDDDDDDEDEEEDEALNSESNDDTRNLFGSARDAVLRIVKKAAEVLVKTGDPSNKNNITKIQESIEDSIQGNLFASCITPRYTINCPNCTDTRFAGVFELLNCRAEHLDDILKISWINETLGSGSICSYYGIDMAKLPKTQNKDSTETTTMTTMIFRDNEDGVIDATLRKKFLLSHDSRANLLASIYTPEYILALCNVIATKEKRLVLNTSYEFFGNISANSSVRIDPRMENFDVIESNGNSRIATSSCLGNMEIDGCKSFGTSEETKIFKIQDSDSSQEQESLIMGSMETTSTIGTTTTETTAAAVSTTTTTTTTTTTKSSESLASQIKPTKALGREDMRKESSIPILEPSKDPNEESIQADVLTTGSPILNVAATATTRIIEEQPLIQQNLVETRAQIVDNIVAVSKLSYRDNQEYSGINENIHDNGASTRHENVEQHDGKNGKTENVEQDAKFIAQEQMSLDSIFSELEVDGTMIHVNTNQNPNIIAQPTASSTPQQKESVFLRLSNRIKALERNMSLSAQYLEELSKRYKKQVEEMQRSLERATVLMSEETRKGEEREIRRIDEITVLRDEITSLSQSMEILLHDRNSWRSKLTTFFQHFVLVVVEIIIFMFVVSYCRRNSEFHNIDDITVERTNEVTRRRSAGTMSSCVTLARKIKKRRPSEIASRIVGNYGDLMIDERTKQDSKREKKKKRRKRELNDRTINNGDTRKDTIICHENNENFGNTNFPSRRSSSIEPTTSFHDKQLDLRNTRKRPDSAPEYFGSWIDQSCVKNFVPLSDEKIDETMLEITNDQSSTNSETRETSFLEKHYMLESEELENKNTELSLFHGGSGGGGGILKASKFSSPSFMKTALGTRTKRNTKITEKIENIVQLRSDNWEWYSRNSTNRSEESGSPTSLQLYANDKIVNCQDIVCRTKNGNSRNTSNESESSGSTTTTSVAKKDKKTTVGGLRRMVRKFF